MHENRPTPGYDFFCNRACQYFPCHKTDRPEAFNCLFCYCPLYPLGDRCGGNFSYTAEGIKNCEACLLPHSPEGYSHILSRFPELAKLAQQPEE